ncbi:MAG: c-type cytochrome [Propionivibrio sp.]
MMQRSLSRIRPCLVFILGGAGLVCALGSVASETTAAESAGELPASALVALGQRIYRDGVLPGGEPLRGAARPGIFRTGADAACAACHRRSGYGQTEGPIAIRPITSEDLFQNQPLVAATPRIAKQLGKAPRPPYDDASLARAIRQGVDVNGRLFSENMPRYELSDQDSSALIAYLKTLAAKAEPAVSDTEIHLATVIQPNVPEQKRQAMLDVLNAFLKDKNAGTRSDEKRRQVGTMRMQRAYRRWNVHVWELNGPADTWPAQLEAYYREQPVFAIISGLGESDWTPIQTFSERFEVPCVFPQVDLPGAGSNHYYTLYLSRGVLLEADVLARYFRDAGAPRNIIQVFRRDTHGAVAADELRAALPNAAASLSDEILDGPADAAFWQQLARKQQDHEHAALVLWLNAADLAGASTMLKERDPASPVFLSSQLLGGVADAPQIEPMLTAGANLLTVFPWDSPLARDKAHHRTTIWLKHKGIGIVDGPVQTDTFFAISIVGDVLAHILDSFSREYFIERVEHAVQQSLVPSSFPHVSLGPDQRFAAKGSYVVRLDPQTGYRAVSNWIVP